MGPAKTCCSFPPFLGSNILSVDKSAVQHLNVCSKIIRQAAKTIEMKWRKKTKSLSDYNAIIYHFSGRNPSSPDKFVMETKPGDFFFRWVISVEDTKQSYDLALPFRPARCDVFILWRNVGQLRTSDRFFESLRCFLLEENIKFKRFGPRKRAVPFFPTPAGRPARTAHAPAAAIPIRAAIMLITNMGLPSCREKIETAKTGFCSQCRVNRMLPNHCILGRNFLRILSDSTGEPRLANKPNIIYVGYFGVQVPFLVPPN